ncbi:F-box protein At1g47056-like [Arachis duranensis]|uniref:F-box protein At1g47056-like n=1 Tax=Arachis duranensis TaxID=130453 RepID=A0A6P4DSS1_ARADU|nr:F-box protein At1g47056-like [Arachis duranensis]
MAKTTPYASPTFMPIVPDHLFFFFRVSFIAPFLPLSFHRPLTPQPSPPFKTSVNDKGLILILLRCVNLTWLKLRGCCEITEAGMAAVGENWKALKKLSCASCVFGIKGINAVASRCQDLEELSVKRLRGEVVGSEMTSVTSVSLKEIVNGQSFAPVMIGSKRLRSLKVRLRSLKVIGYLGGIGMTPLRRLGTSTLRWLMFTLRRFKLAMWVLWELALIGIYPTSSSLESIASKCKALERLALCGLNTVGDVEIECVANKCVALKKFCIKGCPISNVGIEALASDCPN